MKGRLCGAADLLVRFERAKVGVRSKMVFSRKGIGLLYTKKQRPNGKHETR